MNSADSLTHFTSPVSFFSNRESLRIMMGRQRDALWAVNQTKRNWLRFPKIFRSVSSFWLLRSLMFSHSYARSAPIFVDEFDASTFERFTHCLNGFGGHWSS